MTYGRFEQELDRHITGNWGADDPAVKGDERYEALITEIYRENNKFLNTIVELIKKYEMTNEDIINYLVEDFPGLEAHREYITKKLIVKKVLTETKTARS